MTEIQASKLADANSQSGSIKTFAGTTVTDHTRTHDQLAAIAQKYGFTPAPTPAQQQDIAKLGTLHGMAFDKAYSPMMFKDHNTSLALFKKEAALGSKPDLKAFAAETLPTLEQHLSMAKKRRMTSQ